MRRLPIPFLLTVAFVLALLAAVLPTVEVSATSGSRLIHADTTLTGDQFDPPLPDQMLDLGGTRSTSIAYGVSNEGTIVGRTSTDSGIWAPFIRTPNGGMFAISEAQVEAEVLRRMCRLTDHSFEECQAIYEEALAADPTVSPGTATAANDYGQVVGHISNINATHAFLLEEDRLRDLGTLTNAPYADSEAAGINAAGTVVGWSHVGGDMHPFVWTEESGMEDIGELVGNPGPGEATAINDLGQVTGHLNGAGFVWSESLGLCQVGGVWEDISDSGILVGGGFAVIPLDTDGDGIPDRWSQDYDGDGGNDLLVDLGSLGGGGTQARAINDGGWVAGSSLDISGEMRAFVIIPEDANSDGVQDTWFTDAEGDGVNNLMVDLGTLGGPTAMAYDVSDTGVVVGSAAYALASSRGFSWTLEGGMVDLGALGGSGPWGYSINNHGHVVAWTKLVYPGGLGLWIPNSGWVVLSDRVNTPMWSDINDRGQVATTFSASLFEPDQPALITPIDLEGDGKPDLWYTDADEDGVNDLMTFLDTRDGQAMGINNDGYVVGKNWEVDYPQSHATLWTPGGDTVDLGTLAATDIDDQGWITGSFIAADGRGHAFVIIPEDANGDGDPDTWYRDTDADGINDLIIDLGALTGVRSGGIAIDDGRIVGTYSFEEVPGEPTLWYGFIWTQETGMMHIGHHSPNAINFSGQIVGPNFLLTPLDTDWDGEPDTWYRDDDGDGWNDLVSGLGSLGGGSSSGEDINDLGQITGMSKNATGGTRAFVTVGELEVEPAPPLVGIIDETEVVPPGGTVSSTFGVPGGGSVTTMVTWPGSDIETTLITPSGLVIDRNTEAPNAFHANGATFETFVVDDPEPGTWTVELFGADVPVEGERTSLQIAAVAANAVPVADAGPDQAHYTSTPAPLEVTLTGSGADIDGDPLTYAWYENGAMLADGTTVTVSLTPGVHTVDLVAHDGKGASTPDTVVIAVVLFLAGDAPIKGVWTTTDCAQEWVEPHDQDCELWGDESTIRLVISGGDRPKLVWQDDYEATCPDRGSKRFMAIGDGWYETQEPWVRTLNGEFTMSGCGALGPPIERWWYLPFYWDEGSDTLWTDVPGDGTSEWGYNWERVSG